MARHVALPPTFPNLGPAPAAVSVTEPVSRAIEVTKRMLFPVNAGKWLTLGFVAWLASLGEGGGSSFNIPDTSGRGSGGGPGLKPAIEWVMDNLSMVVVITVAVLVVGVAIGVVMTWVSSRAKLMFVHCIVNDEAKVEEPWRRYAERGKDLFWVRLYLGLAGLAVLLVGLGVAAVMAWPELSTGNLGTTSVIALVVGVVIILLGSVPLGIAGALIEDFVVVAMYLFDEPVGPSWRRVKGDIISGNVGAIVVFYLMKLVLGLAVGVLGALATCVTCCIAGLPYVGTVLLLPLFVFMRSYSLCYIEQYGEAWRLFPLPQPPFDVGFSGP